MRWRRAETSGSYDSAARKPTTATPAEEAKNWRGDQLPPFAVPDPSKPAADQPVRQFGPYKPLDRSPGGRLTPLQQEHLDNLIAAYTARTPRSKAYTQKHRATWPTRARSPAYRAGRGRRWFIRSW